MALAQNKDGKWINIEADDAQIGLLNAKAEFNFYYSGGASAAGSLVSSGAPMALKGLAGTAAGQSIPIIGQALAIVTAAISIGQMIKASSNAKYISAKMEADMEINKIIRENLSLAQWATNVRIDQNDKKIAFAQTLLLEHKTIQIITIGTLAMSTMVFAYGIKMSK